MNSPALTYHGEMVIVMMMMKDLAQKEIDSKCPRVLGHDQIDCDDDDDHNVIIIITITYYVIIIIIITI